MCSFFSTFDLWFRYTTLHIHTRNKQNIHPQEAFFAARAAFATSLAAFNVCSYVAGVGDRHTENFMVARSGAVVGIDFGVVRVAFACRHA